MYRAYQNEMYHLNHFQMYRLSKFNQCQLRLDPEVCRFSKCNDIFVSENSNTQRYVKQKSNNDRPESNHKGVRKRHSSA